ncbi:hypothetical protein CDCA_CDCA12G3512 [Cyanidium caldarium]|uniref:Uncharacterized protein n=1 Tax=Cyanidium caldarium TaxID=2771 RepID=A0AAV9IYW8_CYACA|nr:hypothetical protein CDCA_CDCA12G3512 [Cyanidium caldarium]
MQCCRMSTRGTSFVSGGVWGGGSGRRVLCGKSASAWCTGERGRWADAAVRRQRQVVPGGRCWASPRSPLTGRSVHMRAASAGVGGMVSAASLAVQVRRLAALFVDLFPVWCMAASYAALKRPEIFLRSAFFSAPNGVSIGLSLIMLSMGATMTWADVGRCIGWRSEEVAEREPEPVATTTSVMVRRAVLLNLVVCFVVMPLVAYLLASTVMTSPRLLSSLLGTQAKARAGSAATTAAANKALRSSIITGMVLLGSVSGGQASNLCTYIAGGDVALSVAMTTVTTLLVTVALPLVTKLLLGAAVPVDAFKLAASTARVVLAPVAIGVAVNTFVLRTATARMAVRPWLPVIGILATLYTIAAALSPVSATVLSAVGEVPIVLAVIGFHIVGGLLGYYAAKEMPGMRRNELTARTVSIEAMFKSPALSFLLASKHFDGTWVLVPSAISLVVLAPLAAAYSVVLRRMGSSPLSSTLGTAPSLPTMRPFASNPVRRPSVRSDALTVGTKRVRPQPATASPMVAAPPRILHPRVLVFFRGAPNPVTVMKPDLRAFLLKMRKMRGMQVEKIEEI